MKNSVLLLVLLLTACASDFRWGGAPGTAAAVKEHGKSQAKSQPAPAKVQQPERNDQEILLPKKREHNIEED